MNLKVAMLSGVSAVAVMALSSPAEATLMCPVGKICPPEQSQDFGPEQTDFLGPDRITLTFDQFDPAENMDQPLTSVHLELIGIATAAQTTITCFAPGATGTCEGSLTSQVTITAFAPGDVQLAVVIPTTVFDFDLTGTGSSVVVPQQTDSKSTMAWFLKPGSAAEEAIVDLFEGTGTIELLVAGDGNNIFTFETGSAGIPGRELFGEGTLTLLYDYDPPGIPEPLTLSLLGFGLAGLGVAARRRRRE